MYAKWEDSTRDRSKASAANAAPTCHLGKYGMTRFFSRVLKNTQSSEVIDTCFAHRLRPLEVRSGFFVVMMQ